MYKCSIDVNRFTKQWRNSLYGLAVDQCRSREFVAAHRMCTATTYREHDLLRGERIENVMPWGPRRRRRRDGRSHDGGVTGATEIIGCRRSVSAAVCCMSNHRRCSGCCSGRPCRSDCCCRRSRRCPPHLQRQRHNCQSKCLTQQISYIHCSKNYLWVVHNIFSTLSKAYTEYSFLWPFHPTQKSTLKMLIFNDPVSICNAS